jgi:hypothetical protein
MPSWITLVINPTLGGTEESEIGARRCPFWSERYTMLDEVGDNAESDEKALRLKQAYAMLNLFEIDRGRAAVVLEEIKEWAYAQEDEQLQLRVDRFLSNSPGHNANSATVE